MREKFRNLFKNSGLLFISSFSSKILVFLLVPLYTNVLSTKEYGIYDLFYSTIQMITPILTLNIIESVFRFTIDKNSDKGKVFMAGLKYTLISICIVILGYFSIRNLNFAAGYNKYMIFFTIYFCVYVIHEFIIQFTRGQDKIKDISVASVFSTITMILSNILFLLVLKKGLVGYFYAMIISLLVPTIWLIIKNKLWAYVKIDKNFLHIDKFERDMIKYGTPLIFISISWYINSVADRYVVTLISGIDENGIYSISYKIPAILNAIQAIFIQAWQISAIKEFKQEDDSRFYSTTYEGCQFIMVIICSVLIMSSKIIASLLFAKEFFVAWRYVPVLLIYIVFNTLSGTIGAVFSAAKASGKLAITGIIGATINIGLNFVLVYKYGAMGAAIATLISSVSIWLMRIMLSRKYIKIKVNYVKHIFEYFLLIAQAILMIGLNGIKYSYVLQSIIIILLITLNFGNIKRILKSLRRSNYNEQVKTKN